MSDPTPAPLGSPLAEASKTETSAEHMIPKSRFDEINTKLQRLEADAAKRETAARAEAEKQAAAKGEWEKLATTATADRDRIEAEKAKASERLTLYEESMERQIKARTKNWPQEVKDAAPQGDVFARFDWLDKGDALAGKLSAERTPGTPAGPRGSGAPSALPSVGDLISYKRQTEDYSL